MQYQLGVRYSKGQEDVEQNPVEALKWYLVSAKRGYAPAQYTLGMMYDEGLGVAQDDEQALKWHRRAAKGV